MIPQSEWVWYGYAGHLCIGSRCAYHMSTRIGRYLISTVGDFKPDGKTRETLSSADDSFFETMVFPCDGEIASGDPNILSWEAVESEHYAKSIDAERNHRALCLKYAQMQTPTPPREGA